MRPRRKDAQCEQAQRLENSEDDTEGMTTMDALREVEQDLARDETQQRA